MQSTGSSSNTVLSGRADAAPSEGAMGPSRGRRRSVAKAVVEVPDALFLSKDGPGPAVSANRRRLAHSCQLLSTQCHLLSGTGRWCR